MSKRLYKSFYNPRFKHLFLVKSGGSPYNEMQVKKCKRSSHFCRLMEISINLTKIGGNKTLHHLSTYTHFLWSFAP